MIFPFPWPEDVRVSVHNPERDALPQDLLVWSEDRTVGALGTVPPRATLHVDLHEGETIEVSPRSSLQVTSVTVGRPDDRRETLAAGPASIHWLADGLLELWRVRNGYPRGGVDRGR